MMLGLRALSTIERVLPWLATYAVHSTLLVLTALLLTSRWSPVRLGVSARDLLWKCALIGGLITASIQPVLGRVPVGGRWDLGRVGAVNQEVRVVIRNLERPVETNIAPSSTTLGVPVHRPDAAFVTLLSGVSLARVAIVLVWTVGALVALLTHARGVTRLDRWLRSRRQVELSPASDVLRYLTQQAGLRRPVYLSTSDQLWSPAAIDGSEICVPRRFLTDVGVLEQESILAHELAHVVRRDVLWLRLTNLVTTVFFFQPLNRVARARWLDNAEFAADDWAVRQTRDPLRLARGLAAVASWIETSKPRLALPGMASSKRSTLVRRVTRLTTPRHPAEHASPRPWLLATSAAVALVGMVAIAPRFAWGAPPSGVARHLVYSERVMTQRGPSGTDQSTIVIVRRTATGALND